VITQPASDQSVLSGNPATFSVSASGGGLTYQWKRNGAALAGQTASALTLNNVQPTDVGTYSVDVANPAGTASSSAQLLVMALQISYPYAQITLYGASATSKYDIYWSPQPNTGWRIFYCGSPGQSLYKGPLPFNPGYFWAASAADTYGDGLTDGYEAIVSVTDYTKIDTDGDGLPDGWEAEWGTSPRSSVGNDGSSGDPDGDGASNLQEYQLGTDPFRNNSTSSPRPVVTISSVNGAFQITRTGSTASSLTVNYTVGGTAAYGQDYTLSPAPGTFYPFSITIPAGASSVTLTPSSVSTKTLMVALVPISKFDISDPSTWPYVVDPRKDRANADLVDSTNSGISDGGVLIFKWYTPVTF
jgi:hypothetical protein